MNTLQSKAVKKNLQVISAAQKGKKKTWATLFVAKIVLRSSKKNKIPFL